MQNKGHAISSKVMFKTVFPTTNGAQIKEKMLKYAIKYTT